MRYLDAQQLRFLKKIRKAGIYDCTAIPDDEMKKIRFLRSEGLLDASATYGVYANGTGALTSVETGIASVQLSEAGKAYFAELAIDKIRYHIPIVLSLLSILLSGLALYCSSFPQETKIINTITITTASDATSAK